MAHVHNLTIFRGKVKFKNITQKIWGVLILLTIITAVEVVLGIYKASLPDFFRNHFVGMKVLNWIFIILTIVKAYYITWDFMHMRDETAALRRMVVWTAIFLICYLVFILLQEGGYIESVYRNGFVKTNF
ncbi:MAG: cytochrome C oxidase subunit IV family protein [Aquaticitalea sp.]